ncbi:MAG: hypothetical protein GX945_15290 [Lentisphaerae bacterium]|nr:hypothetical protein [Lentisphaerota bacterium]
MRFTHIALALCCLSAFGAEVRVAVRNGVPQIQVDGAAVRPRWFWGGPTTTSIAIKPGEQVIDVERLPLNSGDINLTFHFRFERKPTTIWLDRFEVLDVTDGTTLMPLDDFENANGSIPDNWCFFPRDERNTVGTVSLDSRGGADGSTALKIEIKNPPARSVWPDFHVYTKATVRNLQEGHRYKIRCWLKSDTANTLTLGVYQPSAPSFIGMMTDDQFQRQIAMAAEVGIDFISPPCPMPWPKPGEAPDWSGVDTAMRHILQANPKAKIVPRFGMAPPTWWNREHPDDLMQWRENSREHPPTFSVSSRRWRRDACEQLHRVITYLEEHYPDNMAGYHPCGQNTSEWFYQDSWQQDFHGYSPVEEAAFRDWLARKYVNDAALQQAWRDPQVTLASAKTPSPQERRNAASYGMLILPGEAQPVIDHNLFLQDEMADAVLELARTVRSASQGRRLSVFFYGYCYEFSSMGRMSACGHLATRKLLASPDIDILCSPISYFDRELGGGGHAMTAAESIMRAGKLWLYEDDTRTHLAAGGSLGGLRYHAGNQWESRQILLRNTGQEIIRNLACWWMDLMRNAWYADPALWAEMQALAPMEEAKLSQPRPYTPPVASVFDEYSAVYTNRGHSITQPLLAQSRHAFARMGAPYGQYFLDDVLAGRVAGRLLVLQNPWVMNAEQRRQLKQAVADKFVLWCHAPAVLDPVQGVTLAASQELTGFALTRLEGETSPETVQATARGRELGLPAEWAVRKNTPLLFAVQTTPTDEVLACWPDGAAAVVLRGKALFCASPQLPRELLRLAARQAGVHLYTDDECVLYSDGVNILVHATKEGPVTLRLPQASMLSDAINGQPLTSTAQTTLRLDLRFGETRIVRLHP